MYIIPISFFLLRITYLISTPPSTWNYWLQIKEVCNSLTLQGIRCLKLVDKIFLVLTFHLVILFCLMMRVNMAGFLAWFAVYLIRTHFMNIYNQVNPIYTLHCKTTFHRFETHVQAVSSSASCFPCVMSSVCTKNCKFWRQ